VPFDASVVTAHAAAIRGARWFSLLGLPFSDDERARLDALAPHVVRVSGWDEARRIGDDPRAGAAYDADADEVVALKAQALETVSPDVLLQAMSAVVDRGLDVFMDAARTAAQRAGMHDETLVRLAAGAAGEAVYRGALASAVAGTGHRFAETEALFAAGRWPLARIDDTLYVF
jgi:hypothetical protein